MTNKERVQNKIKEIFQDEMKLAGYPDQMEKMNYNNLKLVLESLDLGDSTDVDVHINRKKYVVEIVYIDKEIDLILLTREEYISRYGDERYEN